MANPGSGGIEASVEGEDVATHGWSLKLSWLLLVSVLGSPPESVEGAFIPTECLEFS